MPFFGLLRAALVLLLSFTFVLLSFCFRVYFVAGALVREQTLRQAHRVLVDHAVRRRHNVRAAPVVLLEPHGGAPAGFEVRFKPLEVAHARALAVLRSPTNKRRAAAAGNRKAPTRVYRRAKTPF